MENLKTYRENGYNDNYVVVVNKSRIEMCETFVTRKAAVHYKYSKLDGHGEVLTFRQAAKKYPDYFRYN
jgi:hypothetical protein